VELDRGGLDDLTGKAERVVLDVGTGDGLFAYTYAREHPDAFVIGVDPARDQLEETSRRALKKPARGGVGNVLFVWADVQDPPAELGRVADEVHVLLPWGRLMTGLVLAEADVLAGLVRMARPGAALRIVLNGEVWTGSTPVHVEHLPELTPEYALAELTGPYAAAGIRLTGARLLNGDETGAIRSTWSRRLHASHGRPRFVQLDATIEEPR
jgi:16S rRNA (adenine(1408)-N(1))-methyltransferase